MLLFCNVASADLIYEIVFEQASYDIPVGQQQSLNILFRETATGGDTAQLAGNDGNGLFSVGFIVDFGSVSPGGPGASFDSYTFNTTLFSPTFSSSFESGDTVSVGQTAIDDINGIEGVSPSGNTYEVLLGTIQFTNNGPSGAVTSLTLADRPGFNLFIDSNDLVDGTSPVPNISFGTATISGVPEPSSGLICCMALALLGFRRLRSDT